MRRRLNVDLQDNLFISKIEWSQVENRKENARRSWAAGRTEATQLAAQRKENNW